MSDTGLEASESSGMEEGLDFAFPPQSFLTGCTGILPAYCPYDVAREDLAEPCATSVRFRNDVSEVWAEQRAEEEGYTWDEVQGGDADLTMAVSLSLNTDYRDEEGNPLFENYKGVDVVLAVGDHVSEFLELGSRYLNAGDALYNPVAHWECLARTYSDSHTEDEINPDFWLSQSLHDPYNGGSEDLLDGLVHQDINMHSGEYHPDSVWMNDELYSSEDGFLFDHTISMAGGDVKSLFDSAVLFFGVTLEDDVYETRIFSYRDGVWGWVRG